LAGDISRALKQKQRKNPQGALLITPESLESMLLNQSGWTSQAFAHLRYIVIDEFHTFIGTERGQQLQSLMHRLEFMIDNIVPRIALSATLGNMQLIAESLRQSKKLPCRIIESNTAILRGKSHLAFANSRSRTEYIATKLSDYCDKNTVPNEFFPHHGNLSKELRESLESRLQENKLPTTAVCTMTLELGIDIGNVDSIAQITAPHSVASLRQRNSTHFRTGSVENTNYPMCCYD